MEMVLYAMALVFGWQLLNGIATTAASRKICTLLQQLNFFTFVSLCISGPVNKLLLSILHGLHLGSYLSLCCFIYLFI